MEEEKPTYYGIIPASVRYDKRLPANAKLLYSELTCLSTKEGYCYASNAYFAEIYSVDPSTISRWIKKLETAGYVTVDYLYNGTEVKERRVYIAEAVPQVLQKNNTSDDEVLQNNQKGIAKKSKGYCKKVKENNTSNNNTSVNNKRGETRAKNQKFTKPTIEEVRMYAECKGHKIDVEEFYDHYEANGWQVGKGPMKDWMAAVRNWERRDKEFHRKKSDNPIRDMDNDPTLVTPHLRDVTELLNERD